MTDEIRTRAVALTGTSVADACSGLHRAATNVLKEALRIEEAKEGGGRVSLTAALRSELRRRGFIRRRAAG